MHSSYSPVLQLLLPDTNSQPLLASLVSSYFCSVTLASLFCFVKRSLVYMPLHLYFHLPLLLLPFISVISSPFLIRLPSLRFIFSLNRLLAFSHSFPVCNCATDSISTSSPLHCSSSLAMTDDDEEIQLSNEFHSKIKNNLEINGKCAGALGISGM